MADHFILYWKPATADEVLAAGGPLRYAVSNQFGRLRLGDVVWPVTCRNGELRVLNRVAVAAVGVGVVRRLATTKNNSTFPIRPASWKTRLTNLCRRCKMPVWRAFDDGHIPADWLGSHTRRAA